MIERERCLHIHFSVCAYTHGYTYTFIVAFFGGVSQAILRRLWGPLPVIFSQADQMAQILDWMIKCCMSPEVLGDQGYDSWFSVNHAYQGSKLELQGVGTTVQ